MPITIGGAGDQWPSGDDPSIAGCWGSGGLCWQQGLLPAARFWHVECIMLQQSAACCAVAMPDPHSNGVVDADSITDSARTYAVLGKGQ